MSSLIFVVMLVVGLVALAALFGEVIGIGIYAVLVVIAGGIIGRIRGA